MNPKSKPGKRSLEELMLEQLCEINSHLHALHKPAVSQWEVEEDSDGEEEPVVEEAPKKRKLPNPEREISNLVDEYGWPQFLEAVANVMKYNTEDQQ